MAYGDVAKVSNTYTLDEMVTVTHSIFVIVSSPQRGLIRTHESVKLNSWTISTIPAASLTDDHLTRGNGDETHSARLRPPS